MYTLPETIALSKHCQVLQHSHADAVHIVDYCQCSACKQSLSGVKNRAAQNQARRRHLDDWSPMTTASRGLPTRKKTKQNPNKTRKQKQNEDRRHVQGDSRPDVYNFVIDASSNCDIAFHREHNGRREGGKKNRERERTYLGRRRAWFLWVKAIALLPSKWSDIASG